MGWKLSTILISSLQQVDKEQLLKDLGYHNIKKRQKQLFEEIMYPPSNKIYIGHYAGNTILCLQDLPDTAMQEELSKTETVLNQYFPKADIVTLVLHSTVNYWGYSIVRNGQKIRVRAGEADRGTFVEQGALLEEEKELFTKARIDAKGNRFFVWKDTPKDKFRDDQVGENFVFALSFPYLGEQLDICEELWNTSFEGYSFDEDAKPWWKWW